MVLTVAQSMQLLENLSGILPFREFLEQRFQNDGDGNPIYLGFSLTPGASQAANVWLIFFVEYVGDAIVHLQMPVNGLSFTYAWNNRNTYFPAPD